MRFCGKTYTNYTLPTPNLHPVKPRILATILLSGVVGVGSDNFLNSEKNFEPCIWHKYKVQGLF